MRFHISEIKLWFKNNSEPRSITFLPNKVNVITGAKSTGKSSILSIIDYCMLSTQSRIVEEMINENVSWYGLFFKINSKDFVIIRKHPVNNVGSQEIYFSSTGTVPITPVVNIDIKSVKSILQSEFGINDNIVIPYGGRKIVAGSKISFRYFLLFNTLSEDIIASTTTYFDFELHDREKYIEALNRIFFLALGVDDANNVLLKEKINNLKSDLEKNERKLKVIGTKERMFNSKIMELIIRAQKFDLIEQKLFSADSGYDRLKELINNYKVLEYSNNLIEVEEFNKTKRSLFRKIRNLERFSNEYNSYRENLKNDLDSLRPIEYLKENFEELIPTLEVKIFINTLDESLSKIKAELRKKRTISTNTSSEIKKLQGLIREIDSKLDKMPTTTKDFTDEAGKFIFIGELKAQLSFYEDKWNILDELPSESVILEQIEELQSKLTNTSERKRLVLRLLEDNIQKYYDNTNSMGVYQNYKVHFDETLKSLKLRKPDELNTSQIGSKSNYMFLHLCLFLGIHELLISQKQKFIPQFIVMDQPSQPYYGDKDKVDAEGKLSQDDDRDTLKDAFQLINTFLSNISREQKDEFQIILLEHAPVEYWSDPVLEHFHLVEEFVNGNALIPERAFKKEKN